jgi:hypothetical protein
MIELPPFSGLDHRAVLPLPFALQALVCLGNRSLKPLLVGKKGRGKPVNCIRKMKIGTPIKAIKKKKQAKEPAV